MGNTEDRTITSLFDYPLKSAKGNSLDVATVNLTGLNNDRSTAIIDKSNRIITGRDYPTLLGIKSKMEDGRLQLDIPEFGKHNMPLPNNEQTLEVKLFRNTVLGMPFGKEASDLLSEYLNGDFRLIHLGKNHRPLLAKRGGKEGERTGFADSGPVHLINLRTLEYLNSKLSNSVSIKNFRPNIVMDGQEPFEEDNWSSIKINGCSFRVQEKTQRCVFTTIDPETYDKDSGLQPLAAIAQMRLKRGSRPTFGITLVPQNAGTIAVGDQVKKIS